MLWSDITKCPRWPLPSAQLNPCPWQRALSSFFVYPAGSTGRVLCLTRFLSCRRSRRILFPTRYPAGAAAGSCFLPVSFSFCCFFFLSGNTSFSRTSLHPILTDLVIVTGTFTTTQARTMMGSEVTMGSLGSKKSFSPKRHQVFQNT